MLAMHLLDIRSSFHYIPPSERNPSLTNLFSGGGGLFKWGKEMTVKKIKQVWITVVFFLITPGFASVES